jgi:hypothetical protein
MEGQIRIEIVSESDPEEEGIKGLRRGPSDIGHLNRFVPYRCCSVIPPGTLVISLGYALLAAYSSMCCILKQSGGLRPVPKESKVPWRNHQLRGAG